MGNDKRPSERAHARDHHGNDTLQTTGVLRRDFARFCGRERALGAPATAGLCPRNPHAATPPNVGRI